MNPYALGKMTDTHPNTGVPKKLLFDNFFDRQATILPRKK